MVNSSSALANPHAARPTTNAVFLDPSGRRWRRLRLVMVGVVVAVLGLLAYAVPHLYDTPALDSRGDALGPELTSAETGEHVPLVGEGPLVRVLEVRREGGVVNGYDPFTRRLETTFSTAQAQHIGDQGYAIQRFGYSATATKTMSLTFDDGPDPRWTPELLNVLSANKVPATFFATGTMIARHPEIIRREVREGHAIANHSLTHTDVSDTSRWRARTELVATDRVIRAVTGQEVGYFRLPYEGDDEKTTQATIDGILRAQRYGYLVTSHDFDTDDWAYASRERKGEIPLPPLTGQNITMLMHDGGGEGRKLTVDYVRRLIPYAKAHGYTFQTMPQAQPQLADRVSTVRPTVWDQLTLKVVQAIYVWPSVVLQVLFLFALASVILIGAVNCLLAAHRHRSRARQEWPGPGELQLPVSVVIPAYNEQDVIRRTIASVLASQYPLVEVLVVDDGSTDSTADAVREMARRNPRVVLIRQANSGKASALNHGLSRARGDYIVTLDADTNLTPTTVGNMIRHFAVDADGRLGAVAGGVRAGKQAGGRCGPGSRASWRHPGQRAPSDQRPGHLCRRRRHRGQGLRDRASRRRCRWPVRRTARAASPPTTSSAVPSRYRGTQGTAIVRAPAGDARRPPPGSPPATSSATAATRGTRSADCQPSDDAARPAISSGAISADSSAHVFARANRVSASAPPGCRARC